ncbi:MAG TPA: hypothetical protein VF765_07600, partial [Polyangiaceae bacterium]
MLAGDELAHLAREALHELRRLVVGRRDKGLVAFVERDFTLAELALAALGCDQRSLDPPAQRQKWKSRRTGAREPQATDSLEEGRVKSLLAVVLVQASGATPKASEHRLQRARRERVPEHVPAGLVLEDDDAQETYANVGFKLRVGRQRVEEDEGRRERRESLLALARTLVDRIVLRDGAAQALDESCVVQDSSSEVPTVITFPSPHRRQIRRHVPTIQISASLYFTCSSRSFSTPSNDPHARQRQALDVRWTKFSLPSVASDGRRHPEKPKLPDACPRPLRPRLSLAGAILTDPFSLPRRVLYVRSRVDAYSSPSHALL